MTTSEPESSSDTEVQTPQDSSRWGQAVSLLAIGLGIGWLTGLSVSPVISSVVSSLLAVGAGIVVGAQSILRNHEPTRESRARLVDARPAALLVIGIALAATLGIIARTTHLLDTQKPLAEESLNYSQPSSRQEQGVLFSVCAQECTRLLGLAYAGNQSALVDQLAGSPLPGAGEIAARFGDEPETVAAILEIVCQHYLGSETSVRGTAEE